jgi:spore maturation protein CgeB
MQALAQRLEPGELVIYGDEGWKAVLNGAVSIQPPRDYYRELPKVYHQAGGVVNLTSFQMPAGLNQRCFDVPAAGGFLLTDHQENLFQYFDPGVDVVTFQSPAELIDKWSFYSAHPAARQAVMQRGRQRILSEHTYQHRVREMLSVARSWF